MERAEIMHKWCRLIEENLEVKLPEEVLESSRIYQDLHIDSIMVLQLVIYIEDEFGVVVPEEDVDPAVFQTVGAMITFIEELRALSIA